MPLRRTKDLGEYTIAASDTDIGKVCDFYFDDKLWTIRYIVVDTGLILPGRKVLISPLALLHPAWSPLHLRVNLTSDQINNSPSVDVHKPISRQHEAEHRKYYGWPDYWEGDGLWGSWPSPEALARASAESARIKTKVKNRKKAASNDAHLRSVHEVIGYHINATDGEIGHLEDFLFDDETWQIRYAIVDTKNWWPGKKILLRPQWIERVSWAEREIYAKLSRESIQKAPEWNPDKPFSREYELKLHKHYGYAPDWTTVK
jgi:uncharacterized protein YrrD